MFAAVLELDYKLENLDILHLSIYFFFLKKDRQEGPYQMQPLDLGFLSPCNK